METGHKRRNVVVVRGPSPISFDGNKEKGKVSWNV